MAVVHGRFPTEAEESEEAPQFSINEAMEPKP
jgi:hypothetical protein